MKYGKCLQKRVKSNKLRNCIKWTRSRCILHCLKLLGCMFGPSFFTVLKDRQLYLVFFLFKSTLVIHWESAAFTHLNSLAFVFVWLFYSINMHHEFWNSYHFNVEKYLWQNSVTSLEMWDLCLVIPNIWKRLKNWNNITKQKYGLIDALNKLFQRSCTYVMKQICQE
jgi:hypothetical protein